MKTTSAALATATTSGISEQIDYLERLARNFWWTWNDEASELFEAIDPSAWRRCNHNPVQMLRELNRPLLFEALGKPEIAEQLRVVTQSFEEYLWPEAADTPRVDPFSLQHPIAYFSMEFGIHECLPIYSGGLGILAGDHLKAASDLRVPLVGVGLFYRRGYFNQRVDTRGAQRVSYPELDPESLPLARLEDERGRPIRLAIDVAGREIHAVVWHAAVGRRSLYLLDTDTAGNTIKDRRLTWHLYGGDRCMRLQQEIILGLGGVQLLEDALGLKPAVYHLNEGHCGFLLLERLRRKMWDGASFKEAFWAVRSSSVFTTHTPVPAGNEVFTDDILTPHFSEMAEDLGLSFDQFLELGRDKSEDEEKAPARFEDEQSGDQVSGRDEESASEGDDEDAPQGTAPSKRFSMTVLALGICSRSNAVSALHGEVCREMWRAEWKDRAADDVPIDHITNGVHLKTWMGPSMKRLLSAYTNIRFGVDHDDPELWRPVIDIPSEELWEAHLRQKQRLLRSVADRLDPEALTLGFARRFAPYKRAALLLDDPEALAALIGDRRCPVQFVFAGKAHPADTLGKELIQKVNQASRSADFKGRIIYLQNYDMALGRLLTQGVDVWLNTPIRPYEASGTSGMKAALNGVINCSILDGWWQESYDPEVGFAIGDDHLAATREEQDERDRLALFDVLKEKVIPLYFKRDEAGVPGGWVEMMKRSIIALGPRFTTLRMLKQYVHEMYNPTVRGQRR